MDDKRRKPQSRPASAGAGYIVGRWTWFARQLGRRMWVRASLFSLAAVLVAGLSALGGDYIPTMELTLAAGSVGDILDILASSMLAVTTFSLTAMVTAFASATANVTPRATQLLVTDSIATNTLSTFVGSFLFAIVGIIGLSAKIYGDRGRILLFVATMVVIVLVTIALLRWIDELCYFGRVSDTLQRVERAASEAAWNWGKRPRLGARRCLEAPADGHPVFADDAGFLQYLDIATLQEIGEQTNLHIYVCQLPGRFVHPAAPIAITPSPPDEQTCARIRDCFRVGPERSFDQDPRFGLVVLSEIASRALSPGVNDPGTAIQVLGSGTRVLHAYLKGCAERGGDAFDRVFAYDIASVELIEDFIDPIARDGAQMVEVQLRIQAVLEALAKMAPDAFGDVARSRARSICDNSSERLLTPEARDRLKAKATWA